MADTQDGIRPFAAADARRVQILVGASVMEQLPTVNKAVYKHPLVIALWLAVSAAFARVAKFTPRAGDPFSYLAPVLAMFTCSIPIMILVEFLQRGPFDRLMRQTVGAPDITYLADYYALHPDGGFWVYEHAGRPVALAALDVVRPEEEQLGSLIADEELPKRTKEKLAEKARLERLAEKEAAEAAEGKNEKANLSAKATARVTRSRVSVATSSTPAVSEKEESPLAKLDIIAPSTPTKAFIRHLYVDLPYIASPLLSDMVAHALEHAFRPGSGVQEVLVEDAVGRPQYVGALERTGFRPVEDKQGRKQGVLGIAGRNRWLAVTREEWKAARVNL